MNNPKLNIDSPYREENCPIEPICNHKDEFRSFDGSCNNLQNTKYGQSFTPVQRLLPNAYSDNVMIPRRAKGQKLVLVFGLSDCEQSHYAHR